LEGTVFHALLFVMNALISETARYVLPMLQYSKESVSVLWATFRKIINASLAMICAMSALTQAALDAT
jgi:hypothetical protein